MKESMLEQPVALQKQKNEEERLLLLFIIISY